MGAETPYLSGVFRFVARLHTLSKRGMRMALAGQPKCRYGMLQSLYNLIEQRQAAQCRPSCLKIFVMRGFSFQIGFHSGVLGLDGGEQSVLYGVGLRQLE